MIIRKYSKKDEESLFKLMEVEGEEWDDYTKNIRGKYAAALEKSITYVACDNDIVCGYSRSIDDCGTGMFYVCDLLVAKPYRGQSLGKKLMEQLYCDFPDATLYVMSDVDAYYEKQGYRKEGSVFEVTK